MRKKRVIDLLVFLVCALLLWYGVFILRGRAYYAVSMGIVLAGLIGLFVSFEADRPGVAVLTMIAALCGVAVGSRILFFFLPQVKPVAAVVVLTGAAFGAEAGFVTGAVSMFVSNFYFMQGSWTPFQMFAMGLIGFFAGLIFGGERRAEKENIRRIFVALYGFFSVVILYGGIVDINTIFFTVGELSLPGVCGIYLSGLPFDMLYGAATAVFLFVLYRPVLKRLDRARRKYGFVDKKSKK